MRILLYSANFAPEPTGIGKYSGDMAAWFVEQGHEVRVVAAPPYYPQWKRVPGYAWPPYRREMWRGVKIWRAPLWVPRAPGGIARVLHLLSFAVASFPIVLRHVFWRPELVLTVAPAMVCAPAGWLTARLCRAQAWLHLQDFEVDLAFKMGLLKNAGLRRVVLGMERWWLRRFDSVSSISHRMIERLHDKGVPAGRTEYFPNWVDLSQIRPSRGQALRRELGLADDSVVVLYSGTLGGKQGLSVIPEAAALLSHRQDIVFMICGDGIIKPQLQASAAQLPNVRFLPLQPVERLGELLAMADMHVLPQGRGAADLVLPSKLSGMLASGRPVIATCNPGTEIHSVVVQCGVAVPPRDAAALAAAVVSFADDAGLRASLGARARGYAETHFERHAVLNRVFGGLGEEFPALETETDAA
jgi:colanic acid biosynthesis glycosyl transferase WcaI